MRYSELPSAAQDAYTRLIDAVSTQDLARSVNDIRGGSFQAKEVKGSRYWYYQYTDLGGANRQLYVGPESEAVGALRSRWTKEARDAAALQPKLLAQAAANAGNAAIPRSQMRVIGRLADHGFFRAGGLLIGTHAFACYGNMFGARWDLDFADAGKSVEVALAPDLNIDTEDAIDSLALGFLPRGSFAVPDDVEFRLDFFTPMTRDARVYRHSQLGIDLQPLKFMEFLLVDVTQAAVLSRAAGAALVNVPDPARFALQRLIAATLRPARLAAKARKDIEQAAALVELLRDRMPESLKAAQQDLVARGPAWRNHLRKGIALLKRSAPDLKASEVLNSPKA